MFIINTVSTCFGHHYAHLQETKTCATAHGVLCWFCWMWLVVVVGRCVVGCEHCEGFYLTSQFAHDARSQKPKEFDITRKESHNVRLQIFTSLFVLLKKKSIWYLDECCLMFFVLSYWSLRCLTLSCSPAAQFVTSSLPNAFAPAGTSYTPQKLSSVYPHSRRLSKRNDFPQEVVCPVATVQVLTAPLQHPTFCCHEGLSVETLSLQLRFPLMLRQIWIYLCSFIYF